MKLHILSQLLSHCGCFRWWESENKRWQKETDCETTGLIETMTKGNLNSGSFLNHLESLQMIWRSCSQRIGREVKWGKIPVYVTICVCDVDALWYISKQAREGGSERARKRASEQASKRASEQASKRASEQASKRASNLYFKRVAPSVFAQDKNCYP